jgi:outer membrane protein insertion porin family
MSTRRRIAIIVIALFLAPKALFAEAIVTRDHDAVIGEIVFVGLRRISPKALRDKMFCREGQALSAERLEHDVRTLGRLGWFDTVRVEREEISDAADSSRPQLESFETTRGENESFAQQRVRLTLFVPELPFLTGVEYSGSRLLSKPQIEKLFAEKKTTPKLGEPENRAVLFANAKGIETALHELGHPKAHVALREETSANATVRVRFQIDDGPHILVGNVGFTGDPAISEKRLRQQMRQLQPTAILARLRGKSAYAPQHLEADRDRLLAYYQNHGYPEARIGEGRVSEYQKISRKWLPWPHEGRSERLAVDIPVEAGPLYKIGAVQASDSLTNVAGTNRRPEVTASQAGGVVAGQPYSAQSVETLRRAWQTQVRSRLTKRETLAMQSDFGLRTVEANRTPDTASHTMRINFRLSDSQPYTVRRLQFEGMRKFPDRYLRKRIVLKEGAPLDERALEAGLARLARTGYFKPIKKEDVHVETNDVTHTADVTIRIEELGQQRMSFVGGRGQFGSTLGLAYMLYNILDREELLSSRIEAGPESLQIALGFAKEGFLGSRGTLALSVFNTFLRPRLIGTVKGPFFKQQTSGFSAAWSYALTATDTVSIDYGISRFRTQYSLALPPALTGLPAGNVSAASSSHSLGLGWEQNTGSEKIALADSVSGGLLGGSENLLRTNAEYGRVFHDRVFNSQNAWAFRTTFSAVGSYSGSMPPYARGFAGDQFVRGLRDGELGPMGVVSSITSSGSTVYSVVPLGANAISAINVEYRVPLSAGVEAAPFFDLGSGRLLPNWLGPNRPSIVDSTNGFLHGSTGLELRWTLPGVGVPVRVYWALNLLRLNRALPLPDGSLFKARNRFSTLGWGLGSMF